MKLLSPLSTLQRLAHEIGDALRCTTCGKLTTVANVAGYRQAFVGEKITLKSHCACAGGPAAHLVPAADPNAPLCSFCEKAPAIYAGACVRCC